MCTMSNRWDISMVSCRELFRLEAALWADAPAVTRLLTTLPLVLHFVGSWQEIHLYLFVCLFVCLSVCLFVCLFVCFFSYGFGVCDGCGIGSGFIFRCDAFFRVLLLPLPCTLLQLVVVLCQLGALSMLSLHTQRIRSLPGFLYPQLAYLSLTLYTFRLGLPNVNVKASSWFKLSP